MSTGHEGTYVDLWYSDGGAGDGKQRWTIKDFPGGAATNEINKISGFWTGAGSSTHGIESTLEKKVTNESGTTLGTEQTNTFSVAATHSVEVDFFVGSAEASTTVSSSIASSISRETSTTMAHSNASTCTATCANDGSGRRQFLW